MSSNAPPWEQCDSAILSKPETLLQWAKTEDKKSKRKVILLAGPTGVGKTDLSLKLAKAVSGEIVSADSIQAYTGADIGTAKVTLQERLDVPHHLIDILPPHQQFNVYDYYQLAQQVIREILDRGNVPIVVGGAGFYFRALMEGPPEAPPSDTAIRTQLEEEAEKVGIESMYERLQEVDPDYASRITFRDRQKIIRGLEIVLLTKKKVSDFGKRRVQQPQYLYRSWFLFRPRDVLYKRIELRCDEMLKQGLVEEVEALRQQGMEDNRSLCLAIGYRQALEFLKSPQKEEDFLHFITTFKQATRQYVKRQFTWFRKEESFRWLNLDLFSDSKLIQLIAEDYYLR